MSDPQNESLANTTEVLCLSGSFMNSARRSSFNSPQRDRNSTFKTIKSQQNGQAAQQQRLIQSPTFSEAGVGAKAAEMQEKYEENIKRLEEVVKEHKKVIREERSQAELEKESLQQQLFSVVKQLEAQQSGEEDRTDFAQMYYALLDKVELLRSMFQTEAGSPARSQRMRSQTGGATYIVKHIQKRVKELQQKVITYEGLIDKAIHRAGTPGQLQEVELLRSENKLLRERISVSEEQTGEMEQEAEELRDAIN